MPARLRCVFCDSDSVDLGSRLGRRALEACARAGIEVVEDVHAADDVVRELRERAVAGEACIAVGRALAGAPVSAVWVGPLDLEVRGPEVRVAEDGDELLYEAVITELAERRGGG